MGEESDFPKKQKKPRNKRAKAQITINIDEETLEYFKALSDKTGIAYQALINMYLRDCVVQKKELRMSWD